MKFSYRLAVALLGFLGLAGPAAAQAQTWPNKPVRVIVSFPAGTTPDIVARVVTPFLSQALGQAFVIDNRSGAGGNIGADVVAKADPDGYTFLVSTNGPVATNKVLYDNLPYDPEKDLMPITLLATSPQLFVVTPSLPVATLPEFVAYAKARAGQLSYGTTGNGSASHLTMEDLKSKAGLDIVHIPYRGFPAATTDLLSGQIQCMFVIAASVLPQVKDGKLKALAITSVKRSSVAPELPTVAELGYPEFESLAWIGMLAPAGTPPDIVAKLAAETQKVLALPQARTALETQGYEVGGGSPDQFGKFISSEIVKWGAVIRRTGAKPDQ